MKRRVTVLLAGALLVIGVTGNGQRTAHSQGQAPEATPEDYLRWREELKNWGRWGPDDQRGAANLITPAKVVDAAALVQAGIVVSLAHAVPQVAAADVPESGLFRRTTNRIGDSNTSDTYQVSYHGLTVAHMDALCHFFFDGQLYNGYPVADHISPERGCEKGDIMAWRDGIATRAVLYDIPQLQGVDWVEPGRPITRADLEAWEAQAGVRAGPGDVALLYVGRWKRRAAEGPWRDAVAGFHPDTIPWMKERDVAFLGHDFNIDWSPRPGWGADEGIPSNPVHQAALNWMGVGIVECLDLERAVETARRLGRYEFLMTFAPLPVEGGTGSPLNPLAIF